jgi:NTE family protein
MTAHPQPEELAASKPIAGQKVVNLALQGVGSHGAFTWGVLDRLLEDERLGFEGITATSAGAVNAVVLAQGLASGGREGARAALSQYWQRFAAMAAAGIFRPSPLDKMAGQFGLDYSPAFVLVDSLTQFLSPYLLNPLNFNPLKDLLNEVVDFDLLRRQKLVKLYLCATNVRTGKVKIFSSAEIGADHVLASACQPLMMHAVEIDGEHYWDGGFMGNPAIFPVIYGCEARDVVLVHLTPTERAENPTTPRSILTRMQEVTFNSSLMREMRAVAFFTRLIDEGRIAGVKRMLIHMIDGEDVIGALANSSKMNGDWEFLMHLHGLGRERAEAWLHSNFERLGIDSAVELQKYL